MDGFKLGNGLAIVAGIAVEACERALHIGIIRGALLCKLEESAGLLRLVHMLIGKRQQ